MCFSLPISESVIPLPDFVIPLPRHIFVNCSDTKYQEDLQTTAYVMIKLNTWGMKVSVNQGLFPGRFQRIYLQSL